MYHLIQTDKHAQTCQYTACQTCLYKHGQNKPVDHLNPSQKLASLCVNYTKPCQCYFTRSLQLQLSIPPPDLFSQNRLGPTGRATCQAYASSGPLQSKPIRSHWQSTVLGCLQCIKERPRLQLLQRGSSFGFQLVSQFSQVGRRASP